MHAVSWIVCWTRGETVFLVGHVLNDVLWKVWLSFPCQPVIQSSAASVWVSHHNELHSIPTQCIILEVLSDQPFAQLLLLMALSQRFRIIVHSDPLHRRNISPTNHNVELGTMQTFPMVTCCGSNNLYTNVSAIDTLLGLIRCCRGSRS
jgi:hypothetical protein